jgi:TP901 family phage tail tape measure protein
LKDLSSTFIKFAEINNTDVTTSIDKVQSAMAMYGMSSGEAIDMMELLTKESQTTGVSVDSLADQLVGNGVALQEMGFNLNQSIGFLGGLSKAGVDSSAVMGGLKKALVNATKDGKTMEEALSDLQTQMLGAKDGTEQMQIAMELFGNKAGPAIANAVQEGKISFVDLNNTVGDFVGSVDETFEATLDPIDNMKTASNDLKIALSEVGSTIGETLAPILKELADGLKKVNEWWKKLSPSTQQFIIKAGMVLAVLGPLLIIIGSLISAIGSIIGVVGIITTKIGVLMGGAGIAGRCCTG